MRTPVTVAVAGLGVQGQSLVRALDQMPAADLRWIFDQSRRPALGLKRRVPHAVIAASYEELLADEALDAIAIATPAASRFQLAHRALMAGKHVLVQSPAAMRAEDAELLSAAAQAGNLRFSSADELPYHAGARRLKALVSSGALGEVYYLSATRLGLEPRREEGVLWSAGAQAVGLVLWMIGDEPIEVAARGGAYGGSGADVAFCHLRFATGIEAEIRLSSIEPREVRELTVVASEAMGVLDERDRVRGLTLYERGGDALDDRADAPEAGDVVSPRLPASDSVIARCEQFVTAVRSPGDAKDGAADARAVVAVLQALHRSLSRGGASEPVGAAAPTAIGEAPRPAPPAAEGTAALIRLPLGSR